MLKVNLRTLAKLLPYFWRILSSLFLWGRPSSGKTSIIRQFAKAKAKELGLKYSEDKFGKEYFTMKVITMSQYDAPDLRGMPQVIEENGIKITRFLATEELPREGQGIIFFDEMNLADDTVRATMYQYILEGRISNLPPIGGFWRVAASNTERDYSNVNTTSLGLLSRFRHLEVEPELDEIINYLLEQADDPRIIGYLKNFPEDLFPKVWDERLLDKKANPFPRQWEEASHLIQNLEDFNLIHDLVGSCVGPEVATRFIAFCKMTGKLDIPRLIMHPEVEIQKILENKDKASLFYAVISSLSSYWFNRNKKLTPKKVVEIAHLMQGMKAAEFSVAFLKMILKKRTTELTAEKEFDHLLTSLGVYFDE